MLCWLTWIYRAHYLTIVSDLYSSRIVFSSLWDKVLLCRDLIQNSTQPGLSSTNLWISYLCHCEPLLLCKNFQRSGFLQIWPSHDCFQFQHYLVSRQCLLQPTLSQKRMSLDLISHIELNSDLHKKKAIHVVVKQSFGPFYPQMICERTFAC